MTSTYEKLENHFNRLAQLEHALTFLQWDQLVMMPPGGNESRSEAVAELSSLHHELLTGVEVGELLEQAAAGAEDAEKQASVREMQREYRWATCIPAELVKAKSLAGSKCEHEWRRQRQENDWQGFLKNFKQVVNLAREEAQARQSCDPGKFTTPYEAMLDLYCTGDSSALISKNFEILKDKLPALISEVSEKQAGRINKLDGIFPLTEQKQLNGELVTVLGFDLNCGRLDESSHPFSTGGFGDHRITSRYRDSEFIDALKATAHETGHAAYEGGLPSRWRNLPVGQAGNMSIHESQSLLFEKQIFLSRPFMQYFTPVIHRHLPASREFDWRQIRLSSLKVQPSFIRVEADELSYPLHVVIRYEIESALINGAMEPEELPEQWDEKMKSYLGLSTAHNYKDGCMQDIHWTDGSFGYFPAYTLGALNGAQIFAAYCREHEDWQEQLGAGEIGAIRSWLENRIWSQGRLLESQQLMRLTTGEGTNPHYFLDYVRARYLQESY